MGGRLLKIGDTSEFPPGSLNGKDVEGRHLIIVNLDGEIRALEGVCTHEYAELDKGFLLEDRVMCPLHLSQFDLRTGEVLSPPAEEPLAPYRVEVRDSSVYVEVF